MTSKAYQIKCLALAKEFSDKFERNFKKFLDMVKIVCRRHVDNKTVDPDTEVFVELALGFVDSEYKVVSENPDEIKYDVVAIIRGFISKSHAFAGEIIQKKRTTLLKNITSLVPLSRDYLKPLEKLVNVMTGPEVETVWNYLRAFLNDSVRYCFYSRVPILNGNKISYQFPRFPNAYTHDRKCSHDENCRGCQNCGKLIQIDLMRLGHPDVLDLKLQIPSE